MNHWVVILQGHTPSTNYWPRHIIFVWTLKAHHIMELINLKYSCRVLKLHDFITASNRCVLKHLPVHILCPDWLCSTLSPYSFTSSWGHLPREILHNYMTFQKWNLSFDFEIYSFYNIFIIELFFLTNFTRFFKDH